MIASVLIVCTGNICRSPAGERSIAMLCPGLKVTSAGLGALVGKPADPVTEAAAKQHFALDLSGHVARQFSKEIGLANDLILAMEPHHRDDIQRGWPQLSGRVMLCSQWSDVNGIEDPYQRPFEVHARVLTHIVRAAETWAGRLQPRITR